MENGGRIPQLQLRGGRGAKKKKDGNAQGRSGKIRTKSGLLERKIEWHGGMRVGGKF
jgi:hypothetical protein